MWFFCQVIPAEAVLCRPEEKIDIFWGFRGGGYEVSEIDDNEGGLQMPIDNGSSIWPKILTCSVCEEPVERGSSKEFKVGARFYSCPTCEESVPSAKTRWVERSRLEAVSAKATSQA